MGDWARFGTHMAYSICTAAVGNCGALVRDCACEHGGVRAGTEGLLELEAGGGTGGAPTYRWT